MSGRDADAGGAISAVSWAAASAGTAALWPDDEHAWAVVMVPLAALVSLLPLRFAGAPRTATNPLARSQERWLPVVHIARLGSDLFVTGALGLSAGIVALLALGAGYETSALVASSAAGVVLERYEKQHPGPLESRRVERMPPGVAKPLPCTGQDSSCRPW